MTGSNSGSDDSNESRKRHSDDHFESGCSSKRPNCGSSLVHLKVLIPSIAAGAVIGKDGEAIERIQKESGAKVKMSKRNDFYPGTLERVCLIVGTLEAVTSTHTFVMERIYEKPDTTAQSADGRVVLERHKQVKILVPNSTAGMIIGKNGTYIQEIKERSEAYVQISQKSREFSLPERCVIVAGELHQMRAAMDLILAVIASDPQSASCPNLSYADVRGPVSSVYPTGSPYAFPFIAASTPGPNNPNANLLLRPDFSLAAAAAAAAAAGVNPYLMGPIAAPLNPMDATVLLQLVNNGDQFGFLHPQQALNAFLASGGATSGGGNASGGALTPVTGAAVPGNQQQQAQAQQQAQQQAQSAPPLATANAIESFRSNNTFLPGMFEALMPSAAATSAALVAAASAGAPTAVRMPSAPPTGGPPQYNHPAATGAFVGAPTAAAYAAAAAAAASFMPLQGGGAPTGRPTSPAQPPTSSATDVGAMQSANQRSSASAGGDATLGMFDKMQRGNGERQQATADAVAPGLWEECKTDPAGYLTNPAAAAALMGLYASANAMAGSNALVAQSATGPQMIRPTPGVAGGLVYTGEILVPENLLGRITGPQGRLLLDLQAQTNTFIQVSPKPIYVSGFQSRVISISGDQMNVSYATAVIENTITIEQINQQVGAMQASLRRPYEEANSGAFVTQIPGKSNGINCGDTGGEFEDGNASNPSNQQASKQPAF